MGNAGRIHRRDLEFTEGIATIRLHGDPALAARELDDVWLPLLVTGHQEAIVILDRMNRLDPEVIAALERVLTHVRGVGGEMALVTSRAEFVEALQAWDVEPAVAVLLDVDSAAAVFRERDVSASIDQEPITPPREA